MLAPRLSPSRPLSAGKESPPAEAMDSRASSMPGQNDQTPDIFSGHNTRSDVEEIRNLPTTGEGEVASIWWSTVVL